VDLEDFENGTAYAHYGSFGVGLFSVDPEEDGYPLTVADYSGTAGEALGVGGQVGWAARPSPSWEKRGGPSSSALLPSGVRSKATYGHLRIPVRPCEAGKAWIVRR
jgi:hypothetical protein